MPDLNLPIQRGPPFFQEDTPWGVARQASHLGFRYGGGDVYYVGSTAVNAAAVNAGNRGIDPMNPFASLQAALSAVTNNNGDTIIVLPGSYTVNTEIIVTKDRVRIFAWDYLRGMTSPSVALTASATNHVMRIDANQVEIAGIRFTASGANNTDCIRVATAGAVIGLHIWNSRFSVGRYGIDLGSANGVATDVHIERCTFLQIFNLATAAGINVDYCQRGLIEENYFQSNIALGGYGILAANRANPGVLIRRNDFQFVRAGYGIFRAGVNAGVSMHSNLLTGTYTANNGINQIIDGGDHGVDNWAGVGGVRAEIDVTT